MKRSPALVIAVFLMMLSPLSVAEGQVEVKLQQAIDKNCDGISESETQAANGECIIYSMEVINHGRSDLRHVVIKGKIPQHTKLHTHIPLENNMLLSATTKMEQLGDSEGFIRTHIETLRPGLENRRLFRYAVRVQ